MLFWEWLNNLAVEIITFFNSNTIIDPVNSVGEKSGIFSIQKKTDKN